MALLVISHLFDATTDVHGFVCDFKFVPNENEVRCKEHEWYNMREAVI